MKKKTMIRLTAVVLLAGMALPGCNFTSAQMTGLFQNLSSIGVGAIFETISSNINPTGDANVQSIIDVGQSSTQTAINNRIDNYIPDDPRP